MTFVLKLAAIVALVMITVSLGVSVYDRVKPEPTYDPCAAGVVLEQPLGVESSC